MFDAIRTDALTARIDGPALRAFRRSIEAVENRRIWPKVVGFVTACVAIVFLALYVTEFDLDLAPWFVVGVAVLFLVCWLLLRRASAKRWRLRYRLDRLAADNGFALEHDIADPDTPGQLFTSGTAPVTVFRMRGRDDAGSEMEIGLHARSEPTGHGGSTTVETLYLLAPRRAGVSPEPVAGARPTAAGEVTGSVSDPGSVSVLDALPLIAVGLGDRDTRFRYEALDDRAAAYFVDALDLTDPISWERITVVRAWFDV